MRVAPMMHSTRVPSTMAWPSAVLGQHDSAWLSMTQHDTQILKTNGSGHCWALLGIVRLKKASFLRKHCPFSEGKPDSKLAKAHQRKRCRRHACCAQWCSHQPGANWENRLATSLGALKTEASPKPRANRDPSLIMVFSRITWVNPGECRQRWAFIDMD